MSDSSPSVTPSKTARLLDLLAYLAGRRFPASGREIMENVPTYRERWQSGSEKDRLSVKRMFERDKLELKELGVPLRSVASGGSAQDRRTGGDEEVRYQLRPGEFYLPAIRLLSGGGDESQGPSEPGFAMRPAEHRLAVEGLQHILEMPSFPLRKAGRRALRKLTFDLTSDLEVEAPPLLHLPAFDPVEHREVLQAVSQAVLRRRLLHFRYYAIGRDEEGDRAVHPQGLLYQGARWYLVAWDPDREAERLFRVDRMSKVRIGEVMEEGFRLPPDFSMEHLREREAWELGGDEEALAVQVHFRYPVSLMAARNGWGRLTSSQGRGGDERSFQVRSVGPFLRWILSHAGDAAILDPPELAREAQALRKRVLEAHR
jgi:proteasome accessory factor B